MTGDKVEKDKMTFAELSDLEMANKVRMLMRKALEHEAVCVGARDRIMYLSQQVEGMSQENIRLKNTLKMISEIHYSAYAVDAVCLAKDALTESA